MITEFDGIVIDLKKFRSSSLILKILTSENSIITSIAKGALSGKKNHTVIGNYYSFKKYSKENNIGIVNFELKKSFGSICLLDNIKNIFILGVSELISNLYFEDSSILSGNIFDYFLDFLNFLTKEENKGKIFLKLITFEKLILEDTGYGLSLDFCAVNKTSENLEYISPKTGHAISKNVAIGYEKKLFKLPKILINDKIDHSEEDIINAKKITSFFIQKRLSEITKKPLQYWEIINDIIKESFIYK